MSEKDRKKIYQEKAKAHSEMALQWSGDDRRKLPVWDGIKRASDEKSMVEAWGTVEFANAKLKEATSEIVTTLTGVQDYSPPPINLETPLPPEQPPVSDEITPRESPQQDAISTAEMDQGQPPEPPVQLGSDTMASVQPEDQEVPDVSMDQSPDESPSEPMEPELPERPSAFDDPSRSILGEPDLQQGQGRNESFLDRINRTGFPNYAAMSFPGVSISGINQQQFSPPNATQEPTSSEMDELAEMVEQTTESTSVVLWSIIEALIHLKGEVDSMQAVLERSYG